MSGTIEILQPETAGGPITVAVPGWRSADFAAEKAAEAAAAAGATAADVIQTTADRVAAEAAKGAADDARDLAQAAALSAEEDAQSAATSEANINLWIVDTLRKSVEAASGGRQTVLYTALGEPCYMSVIPAFNIEDVVGGAGLGTGRHPAFIVDGVPKSELFIGSHLAAVVAGEALSQPGKPLTVTVDWDAALAHCAANGAGWHLMTVWEWAAVAMWCMANGFEPRGNTDYGRHHDERHEVGRRDDGLAPGTGSGNGSTLTGSGPTAWSHDGTGAGIMDLVGNVWEWLGGMKLEDGRVHMTADNDYSELETNWPAQDLWFSSSSPSAGGPMSLVTSEMDVVRNGPIGDDTNGGFSNSTNPWSSLVVDGTPPLIAQQAMIAPGGISPVGQGAARTYGARFPRRGGAHNNGSAAGLGALYLILSRSTAGTTIGFRPAFVL